MPQIFLELDASGAVTGITQFSMASAEGADATDMLAGSTDAAGSSIDGMAAKLIGAAGAVVSIAVAIQQLEKSLNIFAEFDDKLRVAASFANATTEEFEQMGRAAAEAGATTSKTASEAAQGLAEFASRGFSVREQLEALVPAIRLAEAAQVGLGRATEVSSGILRGYGKDVSELERINDIIVGISGASAANLDFVGQAAKNAIPAARAVGEEFETVAAILGVLADQQFEAGQSGNAIKSILISLVGPTNKAQGALDKLGISTKDAAGNFIGIVPVLKQFKAANLGLTDSSTIFGREFATAALAITNSIGEVESDLELLKFGIDGITESTADFQQAGLNGAFRRLESATEAVYLAVGGQLAPVVQDIVILMTEFAGSASSAASATSGIITGVHALAQVLLGAFNAVDIVVDALTGLFSFAVNNSPLFRGLELIAEGLEKIGVIDVNPFEAARKGITEFAAAQDGSLERVQKRVEGLNSRFAKYQKNVSDNLESIKKQEAAERALTTASEGAATAAGKQAIAAGKSTREALQAAKAARKAYLVTAEAAKAQEAADKKSITTAEKRRVALEKQAKTVKEQALLYGATESAAQAAADSVLEAGEAANGITGTGPEALNNSLDQTIIKAGAAQTALAGIGDIGLPSGGGGEISYSVGLSTQQFDQKVTDLENKVSELNNNLTIAINSDSENVTALATELDKVEKKLADTTAIQGYNEQLRGLRKEYGKVHQFFLDRKLEIVTDREAEALIRGQINAVNDLKFSIEGVVPGLERVDGAWKQIPVTVNAAVVPAIETIGRLVDESVETGDSWRQIDGVWNQVLPNGVLLVEKMNGTLSAGTEIAYGFGQAVAGAAQAASGEISPVEEALKKVEDQIIKTQNAAGSLKFDQLATQTGALNTVKAEIKALNKSLKGVSTTSEESEKAVKRLLQLEVVKSQLSKNISGLKKEIFGTGEESKKTGKKAKKAAADIAQIPKATEKAAQAVRGLAAANEELEQTQGDIARAAWSASKTFTTTSTNDIDSINAKIEKLKEEEKVIQRMNDIIFGKQADFTGINFKARDKTLGQEQIQDLENKKFEIRMEKFIKSKLGATDLSDASSVAPSQAKPQTTINNNFYGMDRSDAVDISKESTRQLARA